MSDDNLQQRFDAVVAKLRLAQQSNRRLRSCLKHAEDELGEAVWRISLEMSESGEYTLITTSGDKGREEYIAHLVVDQLRLRNMQPPPEGTPPHRVDGDGSDDAPPRDPSAGGST